jgi:hypothetical protein
MKNDSHTPEFSSHFKRPCGVSLISAVSALSICFLGSAASGQTVLFGSDNDGLGGFTQSTPSTGESWSTLAGSVRNVNDGTLNAQSTLNSSFLGEYVLNRANGSSYNFLGTLTWAGGDPDRNSRFGMYFFGDNATIPNEDELGALGVIFNTDDGGIDQDDNADDQLGIYVGIDQNQLTTTSRTQTLVPIASDLIGSQIYLSIMISFIDSAGTDSIEIEASMTAGGETTVTNTVVTAADYTGDYFGFVTRTRDDTSGLPWTVDYESFELTQIAVPEPSAFALIAGGFASLILVRRRRS